jgi:hypothetical protein
MQTIEKPMPWKLIIGDIIGKRTKSESNIIPFLCDVRYKNTIGRKSYELLKRDWVWMNETRDVICHHSSATGVGRSQYQKTWWFIETVRNVMCLEMCVCSQSKVSDDASCRILFFVHWYKLWWDMKNHRKCGETQIFA